MKLVALCGLHGAGKDTVADALPARKLAFADVLYREVAASWGIPESELRYRDGKEVERVEFRVNASEDTEFVCFCLNTFTSLNTSFELSAGAWVEIPRSPRQILQWWGDYRRAQEPDYFLNALLDDYHQIYDGYESFVITDCRFPNEAAMVRQLGGQIWQVLRHGHNPPCNGHESENDGTDFKPDVIFLNNGTVAELQESALEEWNK